MLESIEISKRKENRMQLNVDGDPVNSILTKLFEK